MDVKIELLNNYKRNLYRNFYLFEFKVTAFKDTEFIPTHLMCENGIYSDIEIPDMKKIKSASLKANESIAGFVFYEKDDIATLRPTMQYGDLKFKIDKKYKDWE